MIIIIIICNKIPRIINVKCKLFDILKFDNPMRFIASNNTSLTKNIDIKHPIISINKLSGNKNGSIFLFLKCINIIVIKNIIFVKNLGDIKCNNNFAC